MPQKKIPNLSPELIAFQNNLIEDIKRRIIRVREIHVDKYKDQEISLYMVALRINEHFSASRFFSINKVIEETGNGAGTYCLLWLISLYIEKQKIPGPVESIRSYQADHFIYPAISFGLIDHVKLLTKDMINEYVKEQK